MTAASATASCETRIGFDFRRADALAGDLQGVVAAAEDVPVAVLVALRPVAVDPDVRPARPVGIEISLADRCRNPRAMPIQGLRMTSSPTDPVATDLPVSSTMSASIPGQGAGNEHGLIGSSGLPIRMPPEISVPPE